jgi:hypothetical protein
MKTKKVVSKSAVGSKHVHFPRKTLKIRTLAKKGGVTQTLVDKLVKSATKTPATAQPTLHIARSLARGKFRRAYKTAIKNKAFKFTMPVILRGLKAINPRFYAKVAA